MRIFTVTHVNIIFNSFWIGVIFYIIYACQLKIHVLNIIDINDFKFEIIFFETKFKKILVLSFIT
jgi:hypothetical protein